MKKLRKWKIYIICRVVNVSVSILVFSPFVFVAIIINFKKNIYYILFICTGYSNKGGSSFIRPLTGLSRHFNEKNKVTYFIIQYFAQENESNRTETVSERFIMSGDKDPLFKMHGKALQGAVVDSRK